MNYGQLARDIPPGIGNASMHPQVVQPIDPLTDRIQKSLSDLFTLAVNAEDDLSAVSRRLFGERAAPSAGEKGNQLSPNGADEAITLSISHVAEAFYRVRQLAAELNGRL